MRALVTGCHGLLGQTIWATCPVGIELVGADLLPKSPLFPEEQYNGIDLAHRSTVLQLIDDLRPTWIINAAAYTNVDGAEKERKLCWQGNVTAVENLALAARKHRIKLLHISTDYIFDGKHGPYDEEQVPNPLGYYGRSKLAGENVLRASGIDFLIIRTMVLYGHHRMGKHNFVTWLLQELARENPVRVVNDQWGNTTLADELAAGIWQAVSRNYLGTLNVAGIEIIDRYSFAVRIAQKFGYDEKLLQPISTAELKQAAPRPMRSGLVVEKAIRELGLQLSDINQGLEKFRAFFSKDISSNHGNSGS